MSRNVAVRQAGGLPAAVSRLAAAANREHRKAVSKASDALEHAVRAGEILAKARDQCTASEWSEFIELSFDASLRTAQKYMRLARNIRAIRASGGGTAITSQTQAAKALTSIIHGDDAPPSASGLKKKRRARRVPTGAAAAALRECVAVLLTLRRQLDRCVDGSQPSADAMQALNVAIDAVLERLRSVMDAAPASEGVNETFDATCMPPDNVGNCYPLLDSGGSDD